MKESFKNIGLIFQFALMDLFPVRTFAERARDEKKVKRGENWIKRFFSTMFGWLPVLLNIFVVCLTIMTGIVVGGLVIGAIEDDKRTIIDNPFVRSLDVYVNPNTKVRIIEPGIISKLKSLGLVDGEIQMLESKRLKESVVEGAYGWEYSSLWFFKADGGLDSDYTQGRTVLVSDPILGKMTFIEGKEKFSTNQEEGLIVTKALLKRLGYQDKIPKKLTVYYKEKPVPISIVGVVKEIYSIVEFFTPEGFWQIYRDHLWNPDPKYDHAHLGPLKPDEANQLITTISGYLKGTGISPQIVERTGSAKWLKMSLSKDEEWVKSYWQGVFLKTVYGYINSLSFSGSLRLDFDYPIEDSKDSFLPLSKKGYLQATVYLAKLDFLEPVAKFIKEKIGLEMDQRVIGSLRRLQQRANFGKGILFGIISILGLICAANIYLTFTQNIQRKIPEIGIFMAIGASRAIVATIYLTESIIIWIGASIIGCFLSNKLGSVAATFLKSNFHLKEGSILFLAPSYLILGVTIFTLLICIVSTLLAALLAVRIQPGQAVRHE